MRKRYLIPILACILLLSCCTAAYAHPGATDANGGHYDHSTGEYHYHHGYPAHQHPDGRCPYNYDDRTGWNSGSSSGGSDSASRPNRRTAPPGYESPKPVEHQKFPRVLTSISWENPLVYPFFISFGIMVLSILFGGIPFADNYKNKRHRSELTRSTSLLVFVGSLAGVITAVGFFVVAESADAQLVFALNYALWSSAAAFRYSGANERTKKIFRFFLLILSAVSVCILCTHHASAVIGALAFACVSVYAAVKLPLELSAAKNRLSNPPPAPRQQSASKPPVANTAPQPEPAPPPEPSPHPSLQREVEVSKPREVEPEPTSVPGPKPSIETRPDPEPLSNLNLVRTYPYYHDGRVITLYAVESSYISHVGYLFSQEQLFVRMKSGRVYTYNNIRPELYMEFIHADSVGEFYNQHIKRNRKQ